MKKERSIIEIIQSADPVLNAHLDSLNMGLAPYKEAATFRNLETGETYLWLAGGIGWPWKDVPGFVVVVAVGKMPGEGIDAPLFTCLDELETDRIEGLLEGCLRLQDRYGFRPGGNLFLNWYGDPDRFATPVNQFNLKHMKERAEGVYPTAPLDFQQPNHFDLYRRRIKSLAEGKSLFAGKCTALRNRLQGLPKDQDSEDCPAIIALGGVVYTFSVYAPWTVRAQVAESSIPTVDDEEKYLLGERLREPYSNE
jgi:hypothetical protein